MRQVLFLNGSLKGQIRLIDNGDYYAISTRSESAFLNNSVESTIIIENGKEIEWDEQEANLSTFKTEEYRIVRTRFYGMDITVARLNHASYINTTADVLEPVIRDIFIEHELTLADDQLYFRRDLEIIAHSEQVITGANVEDADHHAADNTHLGQYINLRGHGSLSQNISLDINTIENDDFSVATPDEYIRADEIDRVAGLFGQISQVNRATAFGDLPNLTEGIEYIHGTDLGGGSITSGVINTDDLVATELTQDELEFVEELEEFDETDIEEAHDMEYDPEATPSSQSDLRQRLARIAYEGFARQPSL
jgi:hypothetical protein